MDLLAEPSFLILLSSIAISLMQIIIKNVSSSRTLSGCPVWVLLDPSEIDPLVYNSVFHRSSWLWQCKCSSSDEMTLKTFCLQASGCGDSLRCNKDRIHRDRKLRRTSQVLEEARSRNWVRQTLPSPPRQLARVGRQCLWNAIVSFACLA